MLLITLQHITSSQVYQADSHSIWPFFFHSSAPSSQFQDHHAYLLFIQAFIFLRFYFYYFNYVSYSSYFGQVVTLC